MIADGTTRTLDGLTLENDTSGAFILQAKNNASLTASNLILNTAGTRGGGAWVDDSQFNGRDLQINVSGDSGTGFYLANNGVASLDKVNITGQGSALGLALDGTWSSSQARATADVTDSTITTQNADAVRVMAGNLNLNNVTASTSGDDSYAVNANSAATIDIKGGDYSTQGNKSHAIWVASEDSSVTASNTHITTTGDDSIAVNAQRGAANITESTIETRGKNGYGLYTEKQVTGDGLTITTSGEGGAGVFAARNGEATLTNSSIKTSGERAPGMLASAGAKATADHVQIETSGKHGFGLWSNSGTMAVSNSAISTTGEGASGLYVNGASAASNVTLDKVTLRSEKAAAIEANAARLTLNVNETELHGGNGQLLNVSNYVDSQNPANNVYSDVTMNVTNSKLNGDVVVSDPANTVAVNLSSASELTGSVTHASSLSLDESSKWYMNNSSSVGQLTNNGTITFSDQSKFDTLTVNGNYAGNGGLLNMNSVLGDDGSQTNKLIVKGNVLQGTTRVAINNLGGHGAQTVEGIKIVDVGGQSQGSFVKTDRIVAGAYDYDLVKKGQSWFLTSHTPQPTPDPTPGPSPDPTPAPSPDPKPINDSVIRPEGGSYTANLAAANNMFVMSLHDRLGETQYIDALTGQKEVTSLWLRQVGGHNAWHDGSGQLKTQSNSYVTQIGGDVARWSSNGADRWHVGVMAGYGNHHNNTDSRVSGYGSKGSVNGYSVGGYATWYANDVNPNGAWLDGWLLYSWFNNDVNGDKLATESYKSHGFTASLEGGYTWKLGEFQGRHGTLNEWFIQPQAQLIWMGVRADDNREQNGTRVTGDGDGNLQTRLGMRTYLKSHHMIDNNKERIFQPFVELNWLHNTRDFATKMDDVRVSQDGARDLGEIKLGVEGQINPRLNLWGNVGVQLGDAGYNDSAAMFGAKYNF